MIVVNEIHDFEEIPPQVQHFVFFREQLKANHLRNWLVFSFWGQLQKEESLLV